MRKWYFIWPFINDTQNITKLLQKPLFLSFTSDNWIYIQWEKLSYKLLSAINLTGRIVTEPYFQAISFPYHPRPPFFVLPVHALKANLSVMRCRREAACRPQTLLYNCRDTVLDSQSFTPLNERSEMEENIQRAGVLNCNTVVQLKCLL